MKAIRQSRSFNASPNAVAKALEAVVSNSTNMTLSWSGNRMKAAILIDSSVWYQKNFRGKSVVLEITDLGEVRGECADISFFSLFGNTCTALLDQIFQGIEENI